jgi:hypothetical protein
MTVLLAGVGGSAAYAAKIFGPTGPDPIAIGFAWVCIYLVVLCVLHSFFCMQVRDFPALYQDPENLMHPNASLDAIREEEVKNIGERIKEATKINVTKARRLNYIRVATTLSPFIFVLAVVHWKV